ncbi:hypothetical protein C922_01999 [Plasmodium inui San Antonio 1]|uniref:Phosphatidylinositol transfer protein N-terminal domain-containing protein n=1 Tax=Plasmodium inui San Antonio 1 TaxID=1237626 RepID=W7A807_9APIC|nr:hypothetical protein C922_01999 [Plasmodium inui San Antonio 1]EUD67810.1 hypothetical protein C922_01999 [Plasmodium inui San Antonio 1]
MKLIEFRLPLPLTKEEYNTCYRYLMSKVSNEDADNTINGVGKNGNTNIRTLVVSKMESFDDGSGKPGYYSFKRMNFVNKIPKWVLNFVDPKCCLIDEKIWSTNPFMKSVYQATGFPKAHVQVESTYHMGYNTEDNPFNISEDLLKERQVVLIDIVNDNVSYTSYLPQEDPTIFYSEKARRGKLEEDWIENSKVIITCYKLFNIDVPYFGILSSKLENWIVSVIKNSLFKYHRKALCWIDEWFDLTQDQLRTLEEGTQKKLEKFWEELGLDVEKDSSLAVQFMADRQARNSFAQIVDNGDGGVNIEMNQTSIDPMKSDSSDEENAPTSTSTSSSSPPPSTKEHAKFSGIKSSAPSGVSSSSSFEVAEKSEDESGRGRQEEQEKVKEKKKGRKIKVKIIKMKKKKGSAGEKKGKDNKRKRSSNSKNQKNIKKKGEEEEKIEGGDPDPSERKSNQGGTAGSKLGEAAAAIEAVEEAEAAYANTLNVGEEPPTKGEKAKGSESSEGKSSEDETKEKKSDKSLSSTGKEEDLTDVDEEAKDSITLATPSDTKIRSRILREVHKVDEDILLREEEEAVVLPMEGGAYDGDNIVRENLKRDAVQMGAEPRVGRPSTYEGDHPMDGEYAEYSHRVNEGVARPWKLHHVFVTKSRITSVDRGMIIPLSERQNLKRLNGRRIGKFKGGHGLFMANPFTKTGKTLKFGNGRQRRKCTIDGANNAERMNDMLFSHKRKYLSEERPNDLLTPMDVEDFYPKTKGGHVDKFISWKGHSVLCNDIDAILKPFNVVINAMDGSQMMHGSQMLDGVAENMESIHNYRPDMRRKDIDKGLGLFYVIAVVSIVYPFISIYRRFRCLFYFLLSAFLCACALVYHEYWNHSCFDHGNVYQFSMGVPARINSVTSFLAHQRRQHSREEFYKNVQSTLQNTLHNNPLYKLNKLTLNFASNSLNSDFQSDMFNNFNEIFSSKNVKHAEYKGSSSGKK